MNNYTKDGRKKMITSIQSINQSINQSVNPEIAQLSINQSIKQPINQSIEPTLYLNDDQGADAQAQILGLAVHSGPHVDNGLTDCDDHTEQLLRPVKQRSVLRRVAHLDDFCAGQQLHDETGRDNRRNAQLHQSTCTKAIRPVFVPNFESSLIIEESYRGWRPKWHGSSRRDQPTPTTWFQRGESVNGNTVEQKNR